MTTLSARYVKQARQPGHVCDNCERRIIGAHLYLYGMANAEKPSGTRLHVECASWEPKVIAALRKAGLDVS
jgi:hypothetical protein